MLNIENGIVTISVPAEDALEVIGKLANDNNINEDGNINLSFDLLPGEEVEKGLINILNPETNAYTSTIDIKDELGSKLMGLFEDEEELGFPLSDSELVEEDEEEDNIMDLFSDYANDEEEEKGSFSKYADKEEDENAESRSIHEISESTKDFIVKQYIQGIPTEAIKSENNVTKSALYSSLERIGIPRKGKLNRIIRRLEDGDSATEIASEEVEDLAVISRIVKDLEE